MRSIRVSEFIDAVNELIGSECVVEGEVANYSVSQGKWIFFDLKEGNSLLSCFSTIFMLPHRLDDGARVRVTGYAKVHEKSGRFSFTTHKVEYIGEGSLKREYELLKKRLELEGLFLDERKRILPIFPSRIAVVASADSAAWGDFKKIINSRWAGLFIDLFPVRVQGEGAIEDIMLACAFINRSEITYDILVLIRGGGSLEDLAAFNSEIIARAIYASRIPVVVGVGHERDETLADFVADVRASTPSHAAEIITPQKKDVVEQLDQSIDFMLQEEMHAVSKKKSDVTQLDNRLFQIAETLVQIPGQVLQDFKYVCERFESTLLHRIQTVQYAQAMFSSLDPQRVLKRGFAIVRSKKGVVVRSPNQVDKAEKVVIELAEDKINAIVI